MENPILFNVNKFFASNFTYIQCIAHFIFYRESSLLRYLRKKDLFNIKTFSAQKFDKCITSSNLNLFI